VNLKLSSVTRYATGSSPLVGVPIADHGVLVFRRKHLKAALEINPTRIIYNADTQILTLKNGGSEWKLNDLLGQGKIRPYQIHEQLFTWAKGKRSGIKTRKQTEDLGKHGVYVRKLREAVEKLVKQRDKLALRRPVNPLLHHREAAGDYSRDEAKNWADDKVVRKAIAKVVGQKLIHGEPKTWADFYRAIEQATGQHVSESQTYARVHGRKRYRHGMTDYPDREAYLKNLPRYIFMAEKPWGHRVLDLYKKDTYGEQLNPLEQHAKARCEYCDLLRERQAIDSQIAAHQQEIESIVGVLSLAGICIVAEEAFRK
jgi:hypothetical protein